MEKLRTEPVSVEGEEFVLEEKDHGDLVVYDIYRKGNFLHKGKYLMTLADDGSILFMNFNVSEEDREMFQLTHLNQFIEKIGTCFLKKMTPA
ncbi:hypothetical protein [Puia sp.]|jgi:hypothetical protein|uniref:hypothetical protein n=1 Tax=Puia sp. TaxID=2045100 RepID=UPI002F3EB71A